MRSKLEAGLRRTGNIKSNKAKRFSQPDGTIVHSRIGTNRYRMGEVAKAIVNMAGILTYVLGILANLNNLLSVLLAAVGLWYVAVQALDKREDWLKKRRERKDLVNNKK